MQTIEPGMAPEGLRERKKHARRLALKRAAVSLSLERGYANVTVEEICEKCGVSPRTFFNYFASKEEAVIGTAHSFDEYPAAEQFASGGPTGRNLADFEHFLTAVVADMSKTRDDVTARHELIHSEPTLAQAQFALMANHERSLRELIERRLNAQDGSDASPARVQLLATIGLIVMRTATERWFSDESAGELTTIIPTIFDELHDLFSKEYK